MIFYGVGVGVLVGVGVRVGVGVEVSVGVGVKVGLGVTVGAIAHDPIMYLPVQPDFCHANIPHVDPIF